MIAGPPNTRPRIWIDDVPEPKRGDPGVGRSDERTDALTFFPFQFSPSPSTTITKVGGVSHVPSGIIA